MADPDGGSPEAHSNYSTNASAIELGGSFITAVLSQRHVGVAVFDTEKCFILVNEQMAEMDGVASASHIDRQLLDIAPFFDVDDESRFACALRGQGDQSHTVRIDRSGAVRSCLEEWFPLVAKDGNIAGVVAKFQDVTEQDLAHARLESVFAGAPVGIATLDRDLRVININQEMASWCGAENRAATVTHARDLAPYAWDLVRPHFDAALRGEHTTAEIDRRAASEPSGPAHLLMSFVPVRLKDAVVGVTVGVAVAATDISEQVKRERAAEAARSFQEDLLYIASHELRTPLTSMIGLSEYLLRAASTTATLSSVEDDVRTIRDESARMARTLDQILDMVRLAAASEPIDLEPVAIVPLVQRQLRMVSLRYPDLRFTAEVMTRAIVDSNADRLTQIITNLLENAAKYAGSSAHVIIRVREESQPPCAVIEVQDDGPGIPPEEVDSIFKRHYRGHSTTGGTGLGLGLYLSRLIAERLGGTLTLADVAAGAGATFALRLPLVAN